MQRNRPLKSRATGRFPKLAAALPEPLHRRAVRLKSEWYRRTALLRLRLSRPRTGRPHGLPGELIVSLTSYPPRFPALHLTLRSLLTQSVQPDRLLLWIAHGDVAELPADIRALEAFGLEIRSCEDLRSYKKLIPALEAYPDAFVVTADDDLYYPPRWLENLVRGADLSRPVIVCRRAHRLVHSDDGRIAPYTEWLRDVQDKKARSPSAEIMPTSGAGALYPPHSLHPAVTDRASFERLCPNGDDLWFYWSARRAGTLHKKVGRRMRLITLADSQASSLWDSNEDGGNDRMIRALEAEFGTAILGLS